MYILDTDHISLYQQGNAEIRTRLNGLPENQIFTTIICYEEQVSGRLAIVRRSSKVAEQVQAFYWLHQTLFFFCRLPVLPFDEAATRLFEDLIGQKLRVGTQDLRIASIAC